ncbi:hypothetical protein SteCoe_30208 [Stentor coeruleus]|uniref:Uncharacterized protein n=1 Tax=Stentor coeruleus TaxID=5963 RepID=A0A1R2B463_9CILI|nr:hypothetical protein SteCoe_30208 [Stentor coeruleus]
MFVRKKYIFKKSKPVSILEASLNQNKVPNDICQYNENEKVLPIHLPLKIGVISPKDHHKNDCSDETPPNVSNLSTENTVSTENFTSKGVSLFPSDPKNSNFLETPTAFSKNNKNPKTNPCQSLIKSHEYSISLSENLLKKYQTKKNLEVLESSQGSKESLDLKNHELPTFHTVEEMGESDLIEKKEKYRSSSGSSTPHLYTDYKLRLDNLLLKNFGHYDENENDPEILVDSNESLSNDLDN